MLHLGLDLSRKRLDVCVLDERGEKVAVTAASPDGDGLRHLAKQVSDYGGPVQAVIESMTGARFVHDTLELCGLGRRDRRCVESQRSRAIGVQDGQDRCLGPRRVVAT